MAEEQKQANLGDALVKDDIITREDLDKAREREKTSGVPWYRSLLQIGKISYDTLDQTLRHEFHPKSVRDEHQSLGKTLVGIKAITEQQLQKALKEQDRTGRLLGEILLDSGAITRQAISMALAKQYGMEYSDLEKTASRREALEAVPESIARKFQLIPISLEGDRLTVLVAKPQSKDSLGDLGVILGKRIHANQTSSDDFNSEIRVRYGSPARATVARTKMEPPPAKSAP